MKIGDYLKVHGRSVTPTLFIRVRENLDAPVEWLVADGPTAEVPVRAGTLADIALPPGGATIVVLVPAAVAGLAEIAIPARNRGQLLKAVPYALEDELAENVEDLHFAVRPGRDEKTLVAVIRRSWLEGLMAGLARHGLTAGAVTPETLCLPWSEGEWTLLAEDEGAVLRTSATTGYAVDLENLGTVLEAARTDPEAPQDRGVPVVRLLDHRRNGDGPALPVEPHEIRIEKGSAPVLTLLARGYLAQRPVNLLQGEFAPQLAWRQAWSRWRVVAGLAAAAVLVYLAGVAVDNHRLEQQQGRLAATMTEVYRSTFPDAVRIINPASQMRSRLAEMRQESGGPAAGFLDLVAGAAPQVLGDGKIGVRLLRYREGRMELDLDADTIERLEALQARLREASFSAELKSLRNEGGRYLGRLVIGIEAS